MRPDDRFARCATQFEAFQLLRLIECADLSAARLGTAARPSHEPVRLGQDAQLRFCAAQVTSYQPASATAPVRVALDFGLVGPQGPMPLHLTEYVEARSRHRGDRTIERFLDVFHHRMSSLLYRAWAASQPVIGLDRPGEDRFAAYLGSVCGLSLDGVPRAGAIDDEAKWGAAGLLSDRRRHGSGLAALLRGVFGVPVAVEPFVGQWLRVPEADRTRLGAPDRRTLGEGYVLGRRNWSRQHKFRIVMGPMDARQSARLQPGTPGLGRIAAWVRLYAGTTFDFDVVLRLTRDSVHAWRLGADTRLGRDTWLGSAKAGGAEPTLKFTGARIARLCQPGE